MFWNRKPKNKRHGRAGVLEVKARAKTVLGSRIRVAVAAASVVLGAVVVLLSIWRGGDWLLRKAVFENPSFAVRTIEVETDGILEAGWIRHWSGVREGTNLLALNLERVRNDLRLVPFIEDVAVERELPGTIRLRVTERVPVARVQMPRIPGSSEAGEDGGVGVYYLDAAGYVMSPIRAPNGGRLGARDEGALPLISGMDASVFRTGLPSERPKIRAALALVAEFNRSSLVGVVRLGRIDLSGPNVLRVTTEENAEVTLGVADHARQMRRWRRILEEGARMGRRVAAMDLSVSNNVPVRWVTQDSGASENQETTPPPTRSKDHV